MKDVRTPVATLFGDLWAQNGETWKTQIAAVRDKFGASIEEVRTPADYPTDVPIFYVKKEAVLDLLRFLRDEPGFEYGFFADMTATDEEEDPRFEVVYQLFSHTRKNRIRVKTRVRDGEEVPSATAVWTGANWAEREIWDMFGIRFKGHPGLRRILMDERWQGHPLRKDYPLRGYQIFPDAQVIHPDQLE